MSKPKWEERLSKGPYQTQFVPSFEKMQNIKNQVLYGLRREQRMKVRVRGIIITVGCMLIFLAVIFRFNPFTQNSVLSGFNRPIQEQIMEQHGYQDSVISTSESIKFTVNTDMLPAKMGETKTINQLLETIGNSEIILEKVVRQADTDDVFVYVKVNQKILNKDHGEFISIDRIDDDGSYSTLPIQWFFYKNNQLMQIHYGAGAGAGNISVNISQEELRKLGKIFQVECKGLYLYSYQRE